MRNKKVNLHVMMIGSKNWGIFRDDNVKPAVARIPSQRRAEMEALRQADDFVRQGRRVVVHTHAENGMIKRQKTL